MDRINETEETTNGRNWTEHESGPASEVEQRKRRVERMNRERVSDKWWVNKDTYKSKWEKSQGNVQRTIRWCQRRK